jgi:hypothetical protein
VVLGAIMHNVGLGIAFGLPFGAAFGALMARKRGKDRELLTGQSFEP